MTSMAVGADAEAGSWEKYCPEAPPAGLVTVTTVALESMAPYDIRIIGDPVLKTRVRDVEEIDGSVARLVDDMLETMYAAPGLGLAANQIGVQKRLFVWDIGDGPRSMVNPDIVESDGEWEFEEGCLSVPGLSWPILRPKRVHVVGLDLDGNEISVEADELEARMFQHELDHLDGILLVERLDDETRKAALRTLRELHLGETRTEASGGLRLP
jgi:peptide deformylase